MKTFICVFESVRLMHFIQFCNIITEILLFYSKYLKQCSIFKMTCFIKDTNTSISKTKTKLCLINPGVCGGTTYFALKTFFIHVTVNADQNEQMPWPN